MQFFPIEYSSLSASALLELCVSTYKLNSHSSITFLKRGFNDTYLIEEVQNAKDDKINEKKINKFILRVYKHNWRSIESIKAELGLLEYLKENNVSVSFPIADHQNSYIQTIQAPEGIRYAVLFSYAEGERIRKLSAEQSYLLGVECGKIHALTHKKSFGEAAHNYNIEEQFEITLPVLKPLLKDYPEQFEYLVQLKEDFKNVFNSVDENELRSGICHGDLHAENFHITLDNQFTFFDFDFFGTGYLAYDIGVFMWYDHKNKTPEIMNAFYKGYETQQPLSVTERMLVPYFSTLRALFQMTLYCKISNGHQLPLWPAEQVADFIKKVKRWQESHQK
ncbi:MAG: phosphotransferase [Bacteroidota bacterium]